MPRRNRVRKAPEITDGSQIDASDHDSSGLEGSAQRGQGRVGSAGGGEENSAYEGLCAKLDKIERQIETLKGVEQQIEILKGMVADLLQQQQQQNLAPQVNPNQQGSYVAVSVHDFMMCDPPIFSATDPDYDPTEFLDRSNRIFGALGCSPVRAVELASIMLRGIASHWFELLMQRRSAEDPPLEWTELSKALLERFFPQSLQRARYREFFDFRQAPGMSVKDYDIKFTRLSRYVPEIVANEHLRGRQFFHGLLPEYQHSFIVVSENYTYNKVLDTALMLESSEKEKQTQNRFNQKARFEGKTSRKFGGWS